MSADAAPSKPFGSMPTCVGQPPCPRAAHRVAQRLVAGIFQHGGSSSPHSVVPNCVPTGTGRRHITQPAARAEREERYNSLIVIESQRVRDTDLQSVGRRASELPADRLKA